MTIHSCSRWALWRLGAALALLVLMPAAASCGGDDDEGDQSKQMEMVTILEQNGVIIACAAINSEACGSQAPPNPPPGVKAGGDCPANCRAAVRCLNDICGTDLPDSECALLCREYAFPTVDCTNRDLRRFVEDELCEMFGDREEPDPVVLHFCRSDATSTGCYTLTKSQATACCTYLACSAACGGGACTAQCTADLPAGLPGEICDMTEVGMYCAQPDDGGQHGGIFGLRG